MLTAQADQPGSSNGSVAHPFLSTRSASPSLNSLHGSRAVLLADRLHPAPIQARTHRILPGTGHEVGRTARVGSKRSRQRLWLSRSAKQAEEGVPAANLQGQQRMAHLVQQD